MYTPPAFAMSELPELHDAIRASPLANLVTATANGLLATPLPLLLDESDGEFGVLHGHLARANAQWRTPVDGPGMAIFMGPDAYVSPSWYATKAITGKVVPTWNYITVQAHGPVEFFDDADRLLDVVTKLTDRHERSRGLSWEVSDAPADFVEAQLRGIVGLRMPITRLHGKRKMSQNRSPEDRAGVVSGLAGSERETDGLASGLIPR